MGMPQHLSLALVECGPGDAPPDTNDGAAGRQIAFCSGLHDTSPSELDPFNPPPGSILTGDITSMKALEPETWYQWTVRSIADGDSDQGVFLFKTRPQ